MKKKAWLSALAVVLVLCCAVGGTLAWLTQKTDAVVNTFTVGDINITLTETEREYKMVPGNTIDKDPIVTVQAGSEACWLFMKVEKSATFDTFVTCAMATGWTALAGPEGVYYRQVDAAAAAAANLAAADSVSGMQDEETLLKITREWGRNEL